MADRRRFMSKPAGVVVPAALVLLFLVVGTPLSAPGADTAHRAEDAGRSSRDEVIGITAGRQSATLATIQQGRVATIKVAEGHMVQAGDLLVALEDGAQQAQVDIARARAESNLEVQLAQTRREWAKLELDRLTRLYAGDHASDRELRDIRNQAEVTRLEHEIARFKHEQAQREFERQQALLEQYHIRAPFSGYVVELLKQPGEGVDEGEGVIELVQLDPLEVWVDCPLHLADRVRTGAEVAIRPMNLHWSERTGEVFLVSQVVNAGSQTFRVKLRVPNEDSAWRVGMKVAVDFESATEKQESVSKVDVGDSSTRP